MSLDRNLTAVHALPLEPTLSVVGLPPKTLVCWMFWVGLVFCCDYPSHVTDAIPRWRRWRRRCR